MKNYVLIQNKLALYSEGVHPEDVERLKNFDIGTKLFKVISNDASYYHLLNYKGEVFRVKPSFTREVPSPKFDFGNHVEVRSKGEKFDGKIFGINWHFKNQMHVFSVVKSDGKIPNKYFLERNLQEVQSV